MQRRHLALVAMGIGIVVPLSRWGSVSEWTEALVRQERVRTRLPAAACGRLASCFMFKGLTPSRRRRRRGTCHLWKANPL